MKVDEIFSAALVTYRLRNKEYGGAYDKHGKVMKAIFPEGVVLKTDKDFGRMALLEMIVGKIIRYSNGFPKKIGRAQFDSARDAGVYSFMLEEIDRTVK